MAAHPDPAESPWPSLASSPRRILVGMGVDGGSALDQMRSELILLLEFSAGFLPSAKVWEGVNHHWAVRTLHDEEVERARLWSHHEET